MVKNVYPVWHEELREYNKRHGIPVTPRANSPRQQTLPGNFVVQIDNIRIIILLVGHCWMQMEFQSFQVPLFDLFCLKCILYFSKTRVKSIDYHNLFMEKNKDRLHHPPCGKLWGTFILIKLQCLKYLMEYCCPIEQNLFGRHFKIKSIHLLDIFMIQFPRWEIYFDFISIINFDFTTDNPSPGSTMRSMQGSLRSQQGSTLRSTFGQGQGSTLKSTGGQPQGILKSPGSTLRSGTGTMKSTSFKTQQVRN